MADDMRQQLRAIKRELLKIMEDELNEWEQGQCLKISDDAWQREKSMQGFQDFTGVMYAELVDAPTEQAWENFHAQRKVKSRELRGKADACLDYWRAEFQKWGAPAFNKIEAEQRRCC